MKNPNLRKKIFISSIYIFIIFIFIISVYSVVSPNATCSDGKQNQKEKGIDCGGPCKACKMPVEAKDLSIEENDFSFGGNESYDAMAKIKNPNNSFGAKSVVFQFNLLDENKNVIGSKETKAFILPAETKYFTAMGIKTAKNKKPSFVEVKIKDLQWEELVNFENPQIGIYNKRFSTLAVGTGHQAEGILKNESPFDLEKIIITVILRNEKGRVIGVNSTEKNAIRSKEERDFKVIWPYLLEDKVKSIDMDAQSNVFELQK